jgi:hypothetical protein
MRTEIKGLTLAGVLLAAHVAVVAAGVNALLRTDPAPTAAAPPAAAQKPAPGPAPRAVPATPPAPTKAAETERRQAVAFLNHLVSRDYVAAYGLLTEETRRAVTPAKFKSSFKALASAGLTRIDWQEIQRRRGVAGYRADKGYYRVEARTTLVGRATSRENGPIRVQIDLVETTEGWQIESVSYKSERVQTASSSSR